MNMISEQIKELRNYERIFNGDMIDGNLSPIFGNAANTIEELSEKLKNGGWIPCSERLPEKSGYYDVTIESKINDEVLRTTEIRCFHKDIGIWAEIMEPEFSIDEKVIAWKNRPEAYHE